MALAGKLSDQTLLSYVPGIDVQTELERLKEREQSELESVKKQLADTEAEREILRLEGGGNGRDPAAAGAEAE